MIGLGSFDPYRVSRFHLPFHLSFDSLLPYQVHCRNDPAHRLARDKRQESRKKVHHFL